MQHETPFPGRKVYFDSFAGLLPGRILQAHDHAIVVQLTMRRPQGGYRPGEIVRVSAHRVVPREWVRNARSHTHFPTIRGGWRWAAATD
jgi:hypothetical protein